jgi:hypothetical protein
MFCLHKQKPRPWTLGAEMTQCLQMSKELINVVVTCDKPKGAHRNSGTGEPGGKNTVLKGHLALKKERPAFGKGSGRGMGKGLDLIHAGR